MNIVDQSVEVLSPSCSARGIEGLKLIEYAGRNCYQSFDKITDLSYVKFIESLIKRGHTAPLEFADMTVKLVTGRDVLCEITRHRLASFCVQSQRYVIDSKNGDISFIKPLFYKEELDGNPYDVQSCEWKDTMKNAESTYIKLISKYGMKPEDARKVLPNSTACTIIMKANVREWRHIMALRSSPAAYPEMRTLMDMLIQEAKKVYPVVFDNLEEK